MIDARELRIGSFVAAKNINIFRVDEIRIDEHLGYIARMYPFIWTENPLNTVLDLPLAEALPIPITDEILTEWCGFEKESKFLYSIGNFRVYEWGQMADSGLTVYDIEYRYTSLTQIFYLHQLQNLYYALTGEELQINIKHTK